MDVDGAANNDLEGAQVDGAASNDLEGAASVASGVDEDGILEQLRPSIILEDRFSQIMGQASAVNLIKSLILLRNLAYEGCKTFNMRTSAAILLRGHPGTGT